MDLDSLFEDALDDDENPVSVADAKKVVDETDPEDLDPHEDDAEMLHVLHPEAADEADLNETALTVPQRMKRAQRMKRLAKRYAMLRKLRAKRMAPADRLMYRARKAALMAIRRRVAGRGLDQKKISIQQKTTIDQMVAHRFPGSKLTKAVDRLARRLLPMIRKKEMDRIKRLHEMQHYGKSKHHEPKKVSNRFTKGELAWLGKVDDEDEVAFKKGAPYDELSRSPNEIPSLAGNEPIPGEEIDEPHSMTNFGQARKERRRSLDEARKSEHGSDAGEEGDTHIINQLRKASIARDSHHHVQWSDGSRSPVHPHHAKMGLRKWQEIMTKSGPGHFPKDKLALLRSLGKNENSFYDTIGLAEKKEPIKIKSLKKVQTGRDGPDAGAGGPLNPAFRSYVQGPSSGQISPSNTFGEEAVPNTPAGRAALAKARGAVYKSPTDSKKPITQTPTPHPQRRARGTVLGSKPLTTAQQLAKVKAKQTRRQFGKLTEAKLPPEVHKRVKELDHLPGDALKARRNVAADKKDQHTIDACNHLLKKKRIKENFTKKAEKYDVPLEIIEAVYDRGLEEGGDQAAFNRVNSFIAGGFAWELDDDLAEAVRTIRVCNPDGSGFHWRKYDDSVPKKIVLKRRSRKSPRQQFNETGGAGFAGTPEVMQTYAAATPGQAVPTMLPAESTKDAEEKDSLNTPKEWLKTRDALAGKRLNEAKNKALLGQHVTKLKTSQPGYVVTDPKGYVAHGSPNGGSWDTYPERGDAVMSHAHKPGHKVWRVDPPVDHNSYCRVRHVKTIGG